MSQNWIPFLAELADIAQPIAKHYFRNKNLKVDQKKDFSPVSEADREIELKIREYTAQKHPELSIVGEEFEIKESGGKTKLIIDPIDGTRNFILGIPHVGALLAIEHDGEVIAGLVCSLIDGNRWWAQKSHGAFFNGESIQVTKIDKLENAQAFYGSLYGRESDESYGKGVQALLSKTYRQRGFGDYYAHVMVAMGCGEMSFDFNLNPWDIAPLKILVEEAGGKLTDLNGVPTIYTRHIALSNGLLHDTLLSYLVN